MCESVTYRLRTLAPRGVTKSEDIRMYAIVEIGGKQFKVAEQDTLFVDHRKQTSEGETLVFENVLLVADGEDVKVGTPNVDGARVTASVLRHVKGDKILVFKKKRRKRYKVKRGHRQWYTQIKVNSLSTGKDTTSNGT